MSITEKHFETLLSNEKQSFEGGFILIIFPPTSSNYDKKSAVRLKMPVMYKSHPKNISKDIVLSLYFRVTYETYEYSSKHNINIVVFNIVGFRFVDFYGHPFFIQNRRKIVF